MRYMTIATIIAGLSGFVVITLAARAFGDNTTMAGEFAAYWGLFFGATGILTGLMQETTRAVAADQPTEGHARPLTLGIWIALGTFLLVIATAPLWVENILRDNFPIAIFFMAVGLGSYAIQATVAGIISGLRLWSHYATLITLDTASRMVVAAIAWWLGWKLVAFLFITVMGAASWLVIVGLSKQVRRSLSVRADVPNRQFLTQTGYAMLASGATAILITSFPTIVQLTHPVATEPVTASAIIYGVIFTRAPILVPLQQFLSALIVRFVAAKRHPVTALAKPLGLVWAVGLLGAVAAYFIGPWLMVTILGSSYYLSGVQLFLLTIGAVCTASIMITGAAAVAMNKHRAYLFGWITATAMAITLMALIDNLATASWLALTIGPLSGLVIHAVALGRSANLDM